MADVSMRQMLEASVHFGHQTRFWHPKMATFIFGERNKVHIINLEKTIKLFEEAYFFIRDSVSAGKEMLFVGTKRQVQKTIEEEALRSGAHFVNQRWLGGTLTNFPVIKSRIQRMIELEEHDRAGDLDRLPNKEAQRLRKELAKLKRNLEGLRNMKRVPDMVFVIDTMVELNAIREAKLIKIPVIAVIDTNCDPDMIDFPIPGNDDAIKATKLIISRIADAVAEGNKGKNFVGATRVPDEPTPDATLVVAEQVAQVAAKEFEEVAVDLEEAFAEKEQAFDNFEAAVEPDRKDESE